MWNSEKNKYSNSRVVRKKISERNKKSKNHMNNSLTLLLTKQFFLFKQDKLSVLQ
jgi:hypothetical protein